VCITVCEVAPILPDGNAELAANLSVWGGEIWGGNCMLQMTDCSGVRFCECIVDIDVPAPFLGRWTF